MELPTKAAGFHKVCNLPIIETMKSRRRKIRSRIDRAARAATVLAALLICCLPLSGYAQQTSTDQAQSHKKTTPDAPPPPADALPSSDAKNGVVKPPDVDPKMAKPVPDVDPAMSNPPPGKTPVPSDPSAPKVQPK
jgi:hypothetical protein